jgi:hypothetical protein
MSDSDHDETPPGEGRRRIAESDRAMDRGERASDDGGCRDPGDPLLRAHAEAVDATSDHHRNQPPGMTPAMEAWQREKQMSGQDASEPGLPRTRRGEREE